MNPWQRGLLAGAGALGLGVGVSYLMGAHKINRHVDRYRDHWAIRPEDHPDGVLHYVALGDSAAQGVGGSHEGSGYVALIGDRLAQATGRKVAVTNLSVSGAVSGDVVRDQLPLLADLSFTPDVVTLDIGGNDTIFSKTNSVETFGASLETILAALPEGSFVADVPWMLLPGWVEKSRLMAERSAELAKVYGHHLVPLHELTRKTGYFGYPRHTAQDWFHPNDRGYQAWADVYWDTIVASGKLEALRG